MSGFQLTQVALVGARISAFQPYGVQTRNELAMRVIAPETGETALHDMPEGELKGLFMAQLPLWVHNILADPNFPGRESLLMPLRRFEGEMNDSRDDEVVASVLSAGFRNQNLDPLDLPQSMPMRQRCTILMQLSVWQEAYRRLERDLTQRLTSSAQDIDTWLNLAREPDHVLAD